MSSNDTDTTIKDFSDINSTLSCKVLKNKVLLKQILRYIPLICMSESTFIFNTKVYEQIKKRDLNSPFISKHEIQLLHQERRYAPSAVYTYSVKPIAIRDISFKVQFDYKMGKQLTFNSFVDSTPADGFVFIIFTYKNSMEFDKSVNYGLGYGGSKNLIGIRFDSCNGGTSNDNQIAVYTNGKTQSLGYGTPTFQMADYQYHQVEIIYNAFEKYLSIYADGTVVVKVDIDINETIELDEKGKSYVGFSTSSGYFSQNIFIKDFNIYKF